MQFFRQKTSSSCHIVALQTALSYFNIILTPKQIRSALPKHSFGNVIVELGIYLESNGIKTKLISNYAAVQSNTQLVSQTLDRYKNVGTYEDRLIALEDFDSGPVIVNVNWYTSGGKKNGRLSHYVVVLKENGLFMLYDGSNFEHPRPVSFDDVIKMSQGINRKKDDGMFLICLK